MRNATTLTLDGVDITGNTSATAINVRSGSVAEADGCVSTNGSVSNRSAVRDGMATTGCDAAESTPPIPSPPAAGQTPRPLPDKR